MGVRGRSNRAAGVGLGTVFLPGDFQRGYFSKSPFKYLENRQNFLYVDSLIPGKHQEHLNNSILKYCYLFINKTKWDEVECRHS